MKKVLIIFLVLIVGGVFLIPNTKGDINPYYSGDAITYHGNVVVATVNSGDLEVFKLENDSLNRVIGFKTPSSNIYDATNFSDVELSIEDNKLYAYLVSSYSLYKYNISDLVSAELVMKQRNTYWEWYNGLEKIGNDIAAISNKGVKIINTDIFDVVGSYDITNSNHGNLNFTDAGYIFNVKESEVEVFNTNTNKIVNTFDVLYNTSDNEHKIYADNSKGEYYIVDDQYFKKFNINGTLLGSFKHLDHPGYDVVSSSDSKYAYFSNGIGVVKMDKETMKPDSWAFTFNLGAVGGWAMGLDVIGQGENEKLIIFNNSSILVMDSNLNELASVKATEKGSVEDSQEALSLRIDKHLPSAGTSVNLLGTGFWPSEELVVEFADSITVVNANNSGRITTTLNIPSDSSDMVTATVTGQKSELTYSIRFKVITQ